MPRNFSKYQYETSPRKIKPEYEPYRKDAPKSKKSSTLKAKNNSEKNRKLQKRKERKVILYILTGFAIMLLLGYRDAQIDEEFAKIQSLKQELTEVEKENAQLKIAIESGLNVNTVAKQAKELLGMQKLSNKQTIYVEAPQMDYVQATAEEIIMDKEPTFLERIVDGIKNIF